MADIQEKILNKFDIDISRDNIFKLYKIEKTDISVQELSDAIDATRKRWNQSINGANEKNAERDRARLEKAERFEAILKDEKLRKELYAFYNKGGEQNNGVPGGAQSGETGFAREYFKLLETSKKIKAADIAFFFEYYQSQRKNKKAILEMLKTDFKVLSLGKEEKYADDDSEADIKGKKKDENSPLIVNLFQEATVLKIKKALEHFEKAAMNDDVLQKFPTVKDGLYDYLGLNDIGTIEEFSNIVTDKSKEIYQIRQEKGAGFVPLVDLFNTLQEVAEYRDVVDNFAEFKLLIRYPGLTPYMYSFTEMKPNTMKGMLGIANREYFFRDDVDFILNYYNPVHDNFGITNSGINALLKKADKKARANKILNAMDEKLGRNKKRKLSAGAEIVHWLVYFPILIIYFVFEVFKAVFTQIHRFSIPLFAVVFIVTNRLFPQWLEIDNILILGKIINKTEWIAYVEGFTGKAMKNGAEIFIQSLMVIIFYLAIYVIPALFVGSFVVCFSEDLNKRYDWIGYERTFKNMLQALRNKTEDQYFADEKKFIKQRIPKIVINLVCFMLLLILIYFIKAGFGAFREWSGYF